MAAILAMAAIGTWAIGTGQLSYVVTNGVSMQPLYHAGDLVIVTKADSYETGQIVAYHGRRGPKVLHRIVGGNAATGFIFKGDNNQHIDLARPTADQLIGRAVLHVPKGGKGIKILFSPSSLGVLGFLVFGAVASKRSRRDIPRGHRKKKVKAMSREGGLGATATAIAIAVKRMPPAMRTAIVGVTVAALLALLLGVLGWMKPLREIHRASVDDVPTMTFTYHATVPHSPAYDDTTVGPPDPIFRKLADKVDVQASYQGDPGTFGIALKMTSNTGWHSDQQLLPTQKFAGRTHSATVTLDLHALQSRADAASKITGMDNGTITLTITATVTPVGKDAFSAPLAFQMTPALLSYTGTPLKATGAVTATTTVTDRKIELFGFAIMMAATARSWAVLLLLVALAGAAFVFLVARRAAPARTRAEIERLYPQLLVHVEPMPSPPGKPVVNVDNFRALAKLAERYGQMVLTWRRPDADDFVVRDEGITYRYRVPLDEPTLHNVELITRPGAGSHRRKASSSPSQVS